MKKGRMANSAGRGGRAILLTNAFSTVVGSSRGRMNAKAENEYQRAAMAEEDLIPEEEEKIEEEQCAEDLPPVEEEAEAVIDSEVTPEEAAMTPPEAVSEPLPAAVNDSPGSDLGVAPEPPTIASDGPAPETVAVSPEPPAPETPPEEEEETLSRARNTSYGATAVPPTEDEKQPPSGEPATQGFPVLSPVTGGIDAEPREVVYSPGDGTPKPIELPEVFQDLVYPSTPKETIMPVTQATPETPEPVEETPVEPEPTE